MLLQSLVDQSAFLGLPVEGYRVKPIRWALELHEDGTLRSPALVDLADPTEKSASKGIRMPVPDVVRTSGIAPILAVDTLEYMLGLPKDVSPTAVAAAARKRDQTHQATNAAADEIAPSPLDALRAFFKSGLEVELPSIAKSSDLVGVRVSGRYLHDDPRVQVCWYGEVLRRKAVGPARLCLVCGTVGVAVDTFPAQLPQGSVPGQSQGLSVVSVNKAAQGRSGAIGLGHTPVCSRCATASVSTLTSLLRDRDHRRRFEASKSVLVWWLPGGEVFDPFSLLASEGASDVRTAFDQLDEARCRPGLSGDRFHAVLLSPNVSRLTVKRWIDVPVDELIEVIGRWLDDHTVASWGRRVISPLWLMARSTGRWEPDRKRYDEPRHGAEDVLSIAALTGQAPPTWLFATVLSRLRSDRHFDATRISLLRVVLRRQHLLPEEVTMPELNPSSERVAYTCGRILAVVDNLQRAAIPDLNTSVADRLIGRFSMAPGVLLPRVLADAQAHLKKLRTSNRGGAAYAIQQRLDSLVASLGAVPRVLTLPEQGEFFLGFHHQRDADATARRDASALRDAGSLGQITASPEGDDTP